MKRKDAVANANARELLLPCVFLSEYQNKEAEEEAEMEVFYSNNGKLAHFNGLCFVRDDRTGYYLNSKTHTRLHRAVYEAANGKIPKGMQIHHKDGDKRNNAPENLVALDIREHMRTHGEMLTDEQRDKLRERMNINARPAAIKWHGSEAGIKWHSEHAKKQNNLGKRFEMVCKQCGRTFSGVFHSRFCSNACKSAARRDAQVDYEQRVCAHCGGIFYANKYSKQRCCSKACGVSEIWKDRKNRKTTA